MEMYAVTFIIMKSKTTNQRQRKKSSIRKREREMVKLREREHQIFIQLKSKLDYTTSENVPTQISQSAFENCRWERV